MIIDWQLNAYDNFILQSFLSGESGAAEVVDEVEEVYTGGFWYAFEEARAEARKREREELLELEKQAKKLKTKLDKQLNQEFKAQLADEIKKQEYTRISKLAESHQRQIKEFGERVEKATQRAVTQQNFSALEALTRELQRVKEEEDFLIQATMMMQ